MSDRGSWVVRGFVAGAIVFALGFMGCSQQKPEAPVEEPAPKAEVKPLPPPPMPAPVRVAPAEAPAVGGETYVVKKGDTLYGIARRYGLKAKDLQEANNIPNPNRIKIGQKLIIPAGGGGGAAPARRLAGCRPSRSRRRPDPARIMSGLF